LAEESSTKPGFLQTLAEVQLKHASAAKKSDMDKNKNIKNVTRCRDSRSAKSIKTK